MEAKKKDDWQWPLGIIIAYLIFVGATLAFVFSTFGVKVDLVTDDYYQKTLVFQEKIDSESNAMSLAHPLAWTMSDGDIVITYPEELLEAGLSGTITMYRPSDVNLDFAVPIEVSLEGTQRVPAAAMQRGLWRMEVAWTSGDKDFFTRSEIFLR
jgi:nitrogen fixation protein FixH